MSGGVYGGGAGGGRGQVEKNEVVVEACCCVLLLLVVEVEGLESGVKVSVRRGGERGKEVEELGKRRPRW